MLTLASQFVVSLCLLAFALTAVRVARAFPRHHAEVFRFGWAVTGGAFLMQASVLIFHNLFAATGFAGGRDSAAWKAVLVWHPILNHSRTFLLAAFCLVLCIGLVRSGRGLPLPEPRVWVSLLVGGALAGAAIGANEAAFSALSHYTAVAVWDLLELLALMGVLFFGVVSGRMERALWFCLAVNAFVLALAVPWFAALAQMDIAGQWVPRTWQLQVAKIPLYLLMIAIARSQVLRLGRGLPPRGLLDAPPAGVGLSSLPR